MKLQSNVFPIIITIIASVLGSMTASRIYDVLKDRGLFSDRSSVKSALTIALFVTPAVLLSFIAALLENGNASFGDYLVQPIDLWVVLLLLAFTLGVGYYVGDQPLQIFSGRTVLRKLAFDYTDSPSQHGWKVDGSLQSKRVSDPTMGTGVRLSGTSYRMDYRLDTKAREGNVIEFMGRFEHNGLLYIGAEIQRHESKANLWLQVCPGNEAPKEIRNKREGWHQWMIYMKPISEANGWGLYRINLKEAVNDTVGEDGWALKELEYIRLRGDLMVNHISILS